MAHQAYRNLQDSNKRNLRERKCMIAGLDWAIDIIEQREAGQPAGRSSTSTEINGGPPNAIPQREFTHADAPVRKEDTTGSQDTNTSDTPRRPITIPGPSITGPRPAVLRPGLTGKEARTTAAEAEWRNIAVRDSLGCLQDLLQDDIRPSKGGTGQTPQGRAWTPPRLQIGGRGGGSRKR